MDWHQRYTQQAKWTYSLRKYLFEKGGLPRLARVLEVGRGTGAILSEISTAGTLHGESRQGADPSFGSRLAESFYEAGIKLVETGPIQGQEVMRDNEERAAEWAVIESDLAGFIAKEEILRMKVLDEKAWESGERVLQVPVYFAVGTK